MVEKKVFKPNVSLHIVALQQSFHDKDICEILEPDRAGNRSHKIPDVSFNGTCLHINQRLFCLHEAAGSHTSLSNCESGASPQSIPPPEDRELSDGDVMVCRLDP